MQARFSLMLLVFAVLGASPVHADTMTPERFVRVEIEVRSFTNASMSERLALERGTAEERDQARAINASSGLQIRNVYRDFGTTAAQHALYGSRNAAAIAQWLSANPDWQRHLDDLDEQFASMLEAYSESAAR